MQFMKNLMIARPEKDEYNEFYQGYVSQVKNELNLHELETQIADLTAIYSPISEEKGLFAYSEGKWTIKEVLGHIIDAERVFAYRIFRISRQDKTPLESFDENEYVAKSRFNERTIAEMLEEFSLLRRANLLLLESFSENVWLYRGTASGFPISVRALAYIMFGHAAHHANILRERYLN